MKTTFFSLVFLTCFTACNFIGANKKPQDVYPDNNYTSIRCSEDAEWFKKFKADLAQEKFAIESVKTERSYRKYDGNKKNYVSIKGLVTRYYIKRQEAQPANYYPDFVMYVIDLNDKKQAGYCFSDLTMATFSPGKGEERIKDIETMTQNGNRVFILTTRAEMFRNYINTFIHKINKY